MKKIYAIECNYNSRSASGGYWEGVDNSQSSSLRQARKERAILVKDCGYARASLRIVRYYETETGTGINWEVVE